MVTLLPFFRQKVAKNKTKTLGTLNRNDSILLRAIRTGHILFTVFFLPISHGTEKHKKTRVQSKDEKQRKNKQRRTHTKKLSIVYKEGKGKKKKCAHIINVRQPF